MGLSLCLQWMHVKIWFSQVERSLGQFSLASAEFWGHKIRMLYSLIMNIPMLTVVDHGKTTLVDHGKTTVVDHGKTTVVDHGKLLVLHIQFKVCVILFKTNRI